MENLSYVSIIVPTFNEEESIGECIESLLRLNYPKNKYEVIIVDNNSKDKTVDIAKRYPVKLFYEKGKQTPYAARNRGIEHSNGEIVAFTDADCIVDKEWVREGIRFFKGNKIGMMQGSTISYQKEKIKSKIFKYGSDLREEDWHYGTCNMFYRKDILKEVGGFDDGFFSGGDTDLAWRIKEKGYQSLFSPSAIVYHQSIDSYVGILKKLKRGHDLPRLIKRHPRLREKLFLKIFMDKDEAFFLVFLVSIFISLFGHVEGLILTLPYIFINTTTLKKRLFLNIAIFPLIVLKDFYYIIILLYGSVKHKCIVL
jgi:glycosyltransferase involved in cell wall biosynthesis